MTNPFLSILITTFNRAFFLKQCLESIKRTLANSRYANDIEIIVLNNGCSDETHEVISEFESILPLRVLIEETNLGFVNGLLKCIDSAKGKYCWFLGDDDYIVLDNIDSLLEHIQRFKPDILLLNHYFYIFQNNRITFLKKGNNRYLMKKQKDCYATYEDYILNARHNNAFFTHIAPVVFRRNLWFQHFSEDAKKRFYRAESPHTHVLLSILKDADKRCYFRNQAIVLCFAAPPRDANSNLTLAETERYARLEVDVVHFTAIFKDIFKEKHLIRHIKDVMLKKSVLVLLLGAKVRSNCSFQFYAKVMRLLYNNYKTHAYFWFCIIPVLITPRSVFRIAYKWFIKKKTTHDEQSFS